LATGARRSDGEATTVSAVYELGLAPTIFALQHDSSSTLVHLPMQSHLSAVANSLAVQTFCANGMLEVVPVNIKFKPMILCFITSTTRPFTASAQVLPSEFRKTSREYRRLGVRRYAT
jgi:hypothetical protein